MFNKIELFFINNPGMPEIIASSILLAIIIILAVF